MYYLSFCVVGAVLCCSMCLFWYGPFCQGALILDLSIFFSIFISLNISSIYIKHSYNNVCNQVSVLQDINLKRMLHTIVAGTQWWNIVHEIRSADQSVWSRRHASNLTLKQNIVNKYWNKPSKRPLFSNVIGIIDNPFWVYVFVWLSVL